MKKSILNIGKALNKAEQKQINGGITHKECFITCAGTGAFAECYENCMPPL